MKSRRSARPSPRARPRKPLIPLPESSERRGWWERLKSGLSRSSQSLTTGIADVFTKRKLDAEALEELEELLLKADLGTDTSTRVVEALSRQRLNKEVTPEEVREVLAAEVEKALCAGRQAARPRPVA